MPCLIYSDTVFRAVIRIDVSTLDVRIKRISRADKAAAERYEIVAHRIARKFKLSICGKRDIALLRKAYRFGKKICSAREIDRRAGIVPYILFHYFVVQQCAVVVKAVVKRVDNARLSRYRHQKKRRNNESK